MLAVDNANKGLSQPRDTEYVESLCSAHGSLGFVRVRSAQAKDPMFLGAAPTMRRWVGRSRFAVVEFATPAQAKAASQALDDGSKWCAGERWG